MPDLTLYNLAYSTCSQKVRLCLHEKGLDYEDIRLNFRTYDQLSDWYLALNPNGVVPTLVHNETPIIDSSVIMEYLDEVFPKKSLTPDNPVDRAAMRAWLRYFEEVPTKAIRFPSFSKVFVRHYKDMTDAEMSETAERRPLRKHFYQKMGQNGFSDELITESMDELQKTVDRMETTLSTQPWLVKDQVTLADYCVAPLIDRMQDLKMDFLWENAPGVTDWIARMSEREAFIAAFYPGSRVSDIYEDLAHSN